VNCYKKRKKRRWTRQLTKLNIKKKDGQLQYDRLPAPREIELQASTSWKKYLTVPKGRLDQDGLASPSTNVSLPFPSGRTPLRAQPRGVKKKHNCGRSLPITRWRTPAPPWGLGERAQSSAATRAVALRHDNRHHGPSRIDAVTVFVEPGPPGTTDLPSHAPASSPLRRGPALTSPPPPRGLARPAQRPQFLSAEPADD